MEAVPLVGNLVDDRSTSATSDAAGTAKGAHAAEAKAEAADAKAAAGSRRGQRWREGRPRTWDEFVQLAGGHQSAALRKWEQSEPVDLEAMNEEIAADPWGWDLQVAQWTTRRSVPACCHRAPRCKSQTAQSAALDWWGSQHSPGHAAAPLNPSSLDTVRRPELAVCIGTRSKCLLRPAVPSATHIGPRLTGVRTEYGVRPRAR